MMEKVGENVGLEVKGDTLTITVNLSKSVGPSKSRKSIVIASTKGNVAIPGRDQIRLGLNVYKPTDQRGAK